MTQEIVLEKCRFYGLEQQRGSIKTRNIKVRPPTGVTVSATGSQTPPTITPPLGGTAGTASVSVIGNVFSVTVDLGNTDLDLGIHRVDGLIVLSNGDKWDYELNILCYN